jgi:hypothetical protein
VDQAINDSSCHNVLTSSLITTITPTMGRGTPCAHVCLVYVLLAAHKRSTLCAEVYAVMAGASLCTVRRTALAHNLP